MIVKLPVVKKEYVGGKVIANRHELEVEIDTSVFAHIKWEEHFQKTVGYDLTTYTKMVEKWIENEETAATHFLGIMKLLYCYINSNKLPTFHHFGKMLEYSVMFEIMEIVADVLKQLGNTISKNSPGVSNI